MKYLFFLAAVLINLFSSPIYCDEQLNPVLTSVQKVQGGNALIQKVLKDGPLHIKFEENFPFDAYWDPSNRTIAITPTKNQVYSLIFELQNAASQKEFDVYDQLAVKGKISKDEYIRAIEKIEYDNTQKTARIIDEGIEQGLLPKDSKTYYRPNFEDHFRDQQRYGHSASIGETYDSLTSS